MAQNPVVTFTMENGDVMKAELIWLYVSAILMSWIHTQR